MSFVYECIEENLPLWEKCLDASFIKALAAGTLEFELMIGIGEGCLQGCVRKMFPA